MRLARCLSLVLAVIVLLPGLARADEPARVVPGKSLAERRKARRNVDLSRGGTRNGALELALGSVTAVVFGVMIGRGAWEYSEGSKLLAGCRESPGYDPLCGRRLPALGYRVAAGIAFGLAVPVAVASAFLFVRGTRTYRQWKAFHAKDAAWRRRTMVTAAYLPGGGQVGLRIVF